MSIDLGGSHVSAGRIEVASGRVQTFLRVPLPPNAGRDALLTRITGAPRTSSRARSTAWGRRARPVRLRQRVCLLTHKLEPLHGVDLRRALADALVRPRRRSRS